MDDRSAALARKREAYAAGARLTRWLAGKLASFILQGCTQMFADEDMRKGFMDAIAIGRGCRPYSTPPAGKTVCTEGAEG